MRTVVVAFGLLLPLAVAAAHAGCATGGGAGGETAGDGGDDGPGAGDSPVGAGDAGGSDGTVDGGGVSAAKACGDYVSWYCAQLETCSAFLLQTQYGDEPTCEQRLQPLCLDELSAPGTGWTGAGLEKCQAALVKLAANDCEAFFYAKPQPRDCRPTGMLTTQKCLYDAQCGSGYCKIGQGSTCGNCVPLGQTGSSCTTSNDCDGNLMCAGTTCQPPSGVGGPCGVMTPCQNGLVCAGGACAQQGGVDAGCDPDSGIGCDPTLGATCAGGTCAAIQVVMSTGSCGAGMACAAGGTCAQGFCTAPVADMGSCDGGESCTPPATCNAGTCGLASASGCH